MLNVFNLVEWCFDRLSPAQSPHFAVNVSPRMAAPDHVVDLRSLCECGRPHHAGSKDTHDQQCLCQRCDSLIRTHNHLSLPLCVGITATLNQDRTAIDHNRLAGGETFLHQKQVGLCNVMSFADSPHGQTLADAFKELFPFC